MTLADDILAVLESSRLPLTMGDIIQDAAVMPVTRGEARLKNCDKEVADEVNRLVRLGKVESGLPDGGAELVYRMKREKKAVQKELL